MAEKKYFKIEEIEKGRKDTNCPNCNLKIETYHDNTEPTDETVIYSSHGVTVSRLDAVIFCEHCDAELKMTELIVTDEDDDSIVIKRAWGLTGFFLQGDKIGTGVENL